MTYKEFIKKNPNYYREYRKKNRTRILENAKQWRSKHPDYANAVRKKVLAKDPNYYKKHYQKYRLQYKAKYRTPEKTEKRKLYYQEYVKTHGKGYEARYIRKSPEARLKYRARKRFWAAILAGKIHKQPCQICGDVKAEGHHPDYSKALDVMWLCKKHHWEQHEKERYGQ